MPAYDFTCEKCNKSFTLTLKLAEYEKKKYQCPKCNSKKVKQNISAFQTITSKKSQNHFPKLIQLVQNVKGSQVFKDVHFVLKKSFEF